MTRKKKISYPHPVLGNGDDIDGSFEVNLSANLIDGFLVLSQESPVLFHSDYFQRLSDNNSVVPAFKVVSPGTLYADYFVGELDVQIDSSVLSWRVDIEIYLVANTKIDDYGDDCFHEDFMAGNPNRKFVVEKGMVVGLGGTSNLFFDAAFVNTLSGIIEFSPIDINEPVSFDTDGSKIIIKYPKDENMVDMISLMSQRESRLKRTFLCLFVLPALSFAYDIESGWEFQQFVNIV